jgi:hypothetical protein
MTLEHTVLIRTTRESGSTHQASDCVDTWQSVSGARQELKQLRNRVQKVQDLWYEEHQQRLAEVRMDTNNSEGHAREVAVSVSHEYLRGEPVVAQQTQRGADEGQDHQHGEQTVFRTAVQQQTPTGGD